MSDKREQNNREYADGYGSGRSGDFIRDTAVGMFHPRDTQWYKGYQDGEDDRHDHGWKSKDDCGDGETDSSGGCFLTTACIQHAGLPDDCHELTVLRNFRDTFLASTEEGREKVAQYYKRGPRLVAAIDDSPATAAIYGHTFGTISRIVGLIESGAHAAAVTEYEQLVRSIESTVG